MAATQSKLKSKLETFRSLDGGERGLENCPIRAVVGTLGSRWSALLLEALDEQPYRFGELRRLVPDISQRMLTQTLVDLQRDGYVHRQVFPTKPPSVEYSLTALGRSMFEALRQLLTWAEDNHRAVREARATYDASSR
jgi:DNA-binding HxlR family transcriptional regulator